MLPQKRLYPIVVRHKKFQFGPRKIKTCEISIFSFPALDKSECIAQYLHDPVGIHKAFKMITRQRCLKFSKTATKKLSEFLSKNIKSNTK